jgi:hypothetical protein
MSFFIRQFKPDTHDSNYYYREYHLQVKILIIYFLLMINLPCALAQEASISGFVLDKSSGESLIGANIYFEEYNYGAIANHSGYYIVSGLQPGDYILVCSYVGFIEYRKQINITQNQSIRLNIVLQPALLETDVVTVTADSVRIAVKLFRQKVSTIEISPLEIKNMPAIAETDLLRTLQSLPGILPISDYSSEIYVRGGTSDQNLYLIDGADVYNPEHAFGLFSTFNTDAIKDVKISKGGFTADYGGRLSSVLDVTNLDGNRKSFEGTAEISLLSAKTTLQMPLGNIGSISGSFRRTYVGETAKMFVDDIPDYYFYDGHLKANFDINADNKLSFSFFSGTDFLKYDFNSEADDAPTLDYTWGNTTVSIRWTHVFNPRFFSNIWLTASNFSSEFSFTTVNVKEENDISDIGLKGQFEYVFSQELSTKFGFEQKILQNTFQQNSPGGIIDINRDRNSITGYFSLPYTPTPDWQIEPGLRHNFFSAEREFHDWAPRLAIKHRLTETINVNGSVGVYYQYLHKVPRPFIADIWLTSDNNYDRSRATHYIIGIQKEIGNIISLEIESYYKAYDNLYSLKNYFLDFAPSAYDSRGRPIYTETDGLFNRGDGNSIGFEILLRKRYGAINGWLAYSLAQTQYTVDGINQGNSYEPRHDRTHVVNAVYNMDIRNVLRYLKNQPYKNDRKRWKFGMNFVYSSGQPITLTSSTYYSTNTPDHDYNQLFLYPTSINNFRLPDYIRLDLSLTYEHNYDSWTLSPYIQIFNIGNRENVWFIEYESEELDDRIIQTVETTNMFPILPTIGVKAAF